MGDIPHTRLQRVARWWFRREDRILQAFIGLCVLAMALLASGCASAPFDYAWTKARAAAPKPWLYVTVSDVDRACREAGASTMYLGRSNACATWTPTHCIIYLPKDAPHWLVAHEERHCNGDQHP